MRRGGSLNFPVWSPDGSRIAAAVIPHRWTLFDVSSGTTGVDLMPPPDPSRAG